MEENSHKIKSKAIEQALANLSFDGIDVSLEYLKQYAQKQEVELEPNEEPSKEPSENVMVKTLTKKEGTNNE